ncbi:sensor histidine kinase [Xylanimonas ulmi]|uniref:histidine kinase n=1 Tax=Xylanimonas ulmi TaxID=228973 RepID=A0A4Q7M463_9MICO|nr:signal transduction histidine kinase [Xylanibacterium ulmi]
MRVRRGAWPPPAGVPWVAWSLVGLAVLAGGRLLLYPAAELLGVPANAFEPGLGAVQATAAHGAPALLAAGAVVGLRLVDRPPRERVSPVLLVAVGAAVGRVAILAALYQAPLVLDAWLVVEVAWFAALVACAAAAGLAVADLARRVRDLARTTGQLERRFAAVLTALEEEEVRVRREVSRELHGSLQHRLVVLEAELRAIAEELDRCGQSERAERIARVLHDLDEVRETDVRRLSHALFPAGADIGIDMAVLLLLERIPVSVLPTLEVDDEAVVLLSGPSTTLSTADRLLIVGAIEEALTNALRHGGARRIDVRLRLGATRSGARALVVEVVDDGVGLGASPPELHGLARIHERLALRGGWLELGPDEGGGARMTAMLPS